MNNNIVTPVMLILKFNNEGVVGGMSDLDAWITFIHKQVDTHS